MKQYQEFEEIKKWYTKVYPDDEIGKYIKGGITFYGLFKCLDERSNVYNFLGITDSTIRERVFDRLSTIMNVGYDYIYNQWLESTK
jgi:hypothetical protein